LCTIKANKISERKRERERERERESKSGEDQSNKERREKRLNGSEVSITRKHPSDQENRENLPLEVRSLNPLEREFSLKSSERARIKNKNRLLTPLKNGPLLMCLLELENRPKYLKFYLSKQKSECLIAIVVVCHTFWKDKVLSVDFD